MHTIKYKPTKQVIFKVLQQITSSFKVKILRNTEDGCRVLTHSSGCGKRAA